MTKALEIGDRVTTYYRTTDYGIIVGFTTGVALVEWQKGGLMPELIRQLNPVR